MEKALRPRRSRAKKRRYTKGELNRLVDSVCHPFFDENPGFFILDGFLHVMVERNPSLSVRKFLIHNLPLFVKQLRKMKSYKNP
jgi:hypothetical protein